LENNLSLPVLREPQEPEPELVRAQRPELEPARVPELLVQVRESEL
jgi:hypothetical protein